MPRYNYVERQEDQSPTRATFTTRAQRLSTQYVLTAPTAQDLVETVADLCGITDTAVTDGRIRRTLPARHPLYRWLYVDSASPQGVGSQFNLVTPGPIDRGSPTIPSYPLYVTYLYNVEFGGRRYNMWQDKDISVVDSTGYDKGGASYAFKYATEWYRFTEFLHAPANQFISAQQGALKFRVSGASGTQQPDGFFFQDSPRLYLPDTVVKIRWYEVPYRYVTSRNSYLSRFTGHVNQNAFGYVGPGNKLGPYRPGELLYLGANVLDVFSPSIPSPDLLAFNFGGGFTRGRLCDLELNFLYTTRDNGAPTGYRLPTVAGTDQLVTNRNWLMAGHNLFPWLTTRKFYYVTTEDPSSPTDQTKWFPYYNSFPFELLFTDPDAQPGSPLLDP